MHKVRIKNNTRHLAASIEADICNSFWQKLHGLMFVSNLDGFQGILIDESVDSRINSAIHMFFMRIDITAVWISSTYKVVDVQKAQKWRPMYMPISPARFILETHVDRRNDFNIGDLLIFENV